MIDGELVLHAIEPSRSLVATISVGSKCVSAQRMLCSQKAIRGEQTRTDTSFFSVESTKRWRGELILGVKVVQFEA